MDALTAKTLDTLVMENLPKLKEALEMFQPLSPEDRETSPELTMLIQESIDLLQLLSRWSSPSDEMQMEEEMPADASGEMSDAEAQRLLMEMDGTASAHATTDKEDKADGDMSDDEAMKLLQAMDAPSSATPPKATKEVKHEPVKVAEAEEEVGEIEELGQSEFGSDPEMIKDFMNNADELMTQLDDQILRLEQNPEEMEVIEEIFRAAHTLKGGAGMFAFKAIERVMHRMENFFDQIRKGKAKATSDAIDVILKALDIIKTLFGGVKEGKVTGVKTAPIVKSLNQLCAGTYQGKASSSGAGGGGGEHHEAEPKSEKASQSKKVEQSTIRVDLHRLDSLVNLVGELVIDRTRFINIEEQFRAVSPHADLASNMTETVQLFGRHMNEVQDIIMKVRMVPIGNAFNKFPRLVRDLAKTLDKEIDLLLEGETTELDKTLVEQISDPLVHLVRNSVDHGIEIPADRIAKGKPPRGKVVLSARQEGNQIIIQIRDDGKGMDKELIRKKGIERGLIKEDTPMTDRDIFNLIFEAGFSTAQKVTNISGRGVGMDVVRKQISKLKGVVDIASVNNAGSTITIQLPLTLAIVQSLLVESKKETFAIPLSSVVESIRINPSDIQFIGDAQVIRKRNMVLPLLYLHEALDLQKKSENFWYEMHKSEDPDETKSNKRKAKSARQERLFVVVVGTAERRFGIVVDNLLNQQEMVIKPMGLMMQNIPCVAGGAILGNGEVVLVLDIAELESHFRSRVISPQVAA